NAKRGLLVGGHPNRASFDVYDVKADCTHPALLASIDLPDGSGTHEGMFAPDGKTYYSLLTNVTPVDLNDPRHPRAMEACIDLWCETHGGSVGEDGTRGYLAQTADPDGLSIVDLTKPQTRAAKPEITSISFLAFPWNVANQSTIPVY